MSAQPQEEFCPRCGQWAPLLDEVTGWCTTCHVPTAKGGEVCRRCGERRPATWYRSNGKHAVGICRACRTAARTRYRRAHAAEDRAYSAMRKKQLGRGKCSVCGYSKPITASGVLMAHQPWHHYAPGVKRCTGSGQPPQEASTT